MCIDLPLGVCCTLYTRLYCVFTTESSLGALPDGAALAGLKLPAFTKSNAIPPATNESSNTADDKSVTEQGTTKKAGNADAIPFTLGEELPPVPAKLVRQNTQRRVC